MPASTAPAWSRPPRPGNSPSRTTRTGIRRGIGGSARPWPTCSRAIRRSAASEPRAHPELDEGTGVHVDAVVVAVAVALTLEVEAIEAVAAGDVREQPPG